MQHGVPPDYQSQQLPPAPRIGIDLIGDAVNYFSRAPKFWIMSALPTVAIATVYSIITNVINFAFPNNLSLAIGSIPFSIAYFIAITALMANLNYHAVRALRGERVVPGDSLKFEGRFWAILGAQAIYWLLYLGGALLCFFPGLIVLARGIVSPLYARDARLGPMESFNQSWTITQNHIWSLLGLSFVLAIIVSLLSMMCGIGLILGAPLSALTYALIYMRLRGEAPRV